MFGYAPGGGPTTLLGGPLRNKAPQQTFPPASCPDGKPVPPASCPDGKPVQSAGRSRRQASVSTRILSDKPSLPVPGHSKPSLPNRANLLQTRYCAAAAPKAQPSLTHPKASTRPRHADAALSRTPPPSTPPQCRPGTAPSRHPARIGRPTTLVPLPALLSLLLRPRRTGLVAPHPRVHALAQHAPLTLNHNSHARLHTRLTAPRQPPLSCPAPSPPPPGPDRTQKNARTTQGAGVGITE